MKRVAFLDSGVLGEVINPRKNPDTSRWLEFVKKQKITLRVAAIIDYELRRNLILAGLQKSINNLNQFKQRQQFISITSESLLEASEIWAKLRGEAKATADIKNIDVDVILAAQAFSLKNDFEEIIIVTTNASDISRFSYLGIQVWDWKQALHDCKYDCINFYN
jgi:predicted nucleic acid-binding protein